MDSPMEGTSLTRDSLDASMADANSAPNGTAGDRELPTMKVSFYELLIRQLQDDGFLAEAHSLSEQLHVQPNAQVAKDALFDSYVKSLKWSFGDEPQDGWKPVNCSPVPPLGPDEKCLNLDTAKAPLSRLSDKEATRRAPEIRLLYTCQQKQACRAVAFSTDGRFCATGSVDGSIKILDCARMRGCAAATEGPLGRMRITEEELSKPITRTLQDHVLGITCLAFHPINPTLFSGSVDKAVKIFDLTRPPGHKKAFSVLQDVHPVRCLSIHPCGDYLIVGTSHPAVRLYDLQTLCCYTAFHQDHHHSNGINDLRCTSDGRNFASASSDGSIYIWDAISNRLVNRLPKAHSSMAVTSLRWSRSMRYLLSSGADNKHRLWDVRQGQEVFAMGFGVRSCDYSTAVFAANERYVASSNNNARQGDVSLFDAHTGSPVFMKLGLHTAPVLAMDSSPVDRTLITGCDDEKARYISVEDRAGT